MTEAHIVAGMVGGLFTAPPFFVAAAAARAGDTEWMIAGFAAGIAITLVSVAVMYYGYRKPDLRRLYSRRST